MPFSNYSELKAEISNHAWRTDDDDFEAALPGFIIGAEALLNFGYGVPGEPDSVSPLRTAEMETAATLTLIAGEATLPADFLEMRRVKAGVDNTILAQLTPEAADERYGANAAGFPFHYTLINGKIKTYPTGSDTIKVLYYAKLPSLSDLAPTNWLLAKNPLAYLYGALMLAEPFMRDDARTAMWNRMFKGVVAGLNRTANIAKYSNIRVRTKGYTP